MRRRRLTPVTVSKVLIWSQVSDIVWRVTLLYSDNTWLDYQLEDYNIQSWLDKGASLFDITGLYKPPVVTPPVTGHNVTVDVADTVSAKDQ